MKITKITHDEKQEIVRLFQSGMRASAIGKKLNRSEAALSVILAPYRPKRQKEEVNSELFIVEQEENWIV